MFENFVIPGNAVAAVAAAEDAEVLSALKMAQQAGLKKAYLTGNKERVTALMRDLGMNPEGIEVLDAQDSVQASRLAVKLVREGRANLLMKGLVDSAILLKAVLNKEEGIMEGRRLSHAALMKVPGHKPFVIADGAVNINDSAMLCFGAIVSNGIVNFKSNGAVLGYPQWFQNQHFEMVSKAVPAVVSYSAR